MSSITHNPKYNLYQLKGAKHIYLFDFDYCQQVKRELPYREISYAMADEWYNNLGEFRRKKVKKVVFSKQ